MTPNMEIGRTLRARIPRSQEDDPEHLLTCEDDCCRLTEAEWHELATLLRQRVSESLACLVHPH